MEKKIQDIINQAEDIVVIQADNPDADSLASALALEQILGDMGKKVQLYCGVNIPTYLRYLEGWDRVQDLLPVKFDASIIVDTAALSLLEKLQDSNSLGWLKSKPCVVIDHHIEAKPTIDFADVTYLEKAVSAGELIYELSGKLKWKRNQSANNFIAVSILSDSLGLTSEGTSARSIEIISELVGQGVSIPSLEAARRATQKKSPGLLSYKAQLLDRVEYSSDGRVAHISIPWEEIEKYSPEYNPSMLVIDEMRQVTGVEIAVGFKTYPDGRITAKLRANYGSAVAADTAKHFGGGGHPYAAGFRVTDGRPFNEIKAECIKTALELLDTLKKDTDDETLQHTYTVG
jgi:phosphoesterase RecJ-like protein